MARIIFLGILLLNIVFFFWEQRKGAPEVYLPVYDTQQSGRQYPEKILLAQEAPARVEVIKNAQSQKVDIQQQNAELLREAEQALQANQALLAKHEVEQRVVAGNSNDAEESSEISSAVVVASETAIEVELISPVIEPVTAVVEATLVPVAEELIAEKPAVVADNNLNVDKAATKAVPESELAPTNVPAPIVNKKITIVEACYQLKTGKYTKAKIGKTISKHGFGLQLFEQKQHQVNSTYWVLTQAATSLQKAKAAERKIKRLGITDYWLFRKGHLKWRLSLGLFSSIERASKAKKILTKRTRMTLDIKPREQAITVTHIKVSATKNKQMKVFAKQFSKLIDHELDCYNGEF